MENSINQEYFMRIWNKYGPFHWDLMASRSNVNKDPSGKNLLYFSRYLDNESKGADLLRQELAHLKGMFCFPPIPMIQKVLKYLEQQKVQCVMILPGTFSPWVNKMTYYMEDYFVLTNSFESTAFTILNHNS